MLLMLASACRLMLLMLVVSWPRCLGVSAVMLLMLVVSWPRSACVSTILALGMLPHVCLSMFGGKLVCWVKTCLTCPGLCLARCSHVGTKLVLLTCYVGSKLLPPVLCSATFGLLQCKLAPAASLPWQLQ